MTAIQAHLNGGPMDDQYITVEQERWYVSRLVRLDVSSGLGGSSGFAPRRQEGTYLKRTDSLGEDVPHDLTGVVEFDWQGWGEAHV